MICVNAGTFTPASSTPTIRIAKSLTLRGAQAGVTPVNGGRSGGESQLHAYQNNAIMSVEASNVEIDGFEFDDATGSNGTAVVTLCPFGSWLGLRTVASHRMTIADEHDPTPATGDGTAGGARRPR